jgi:3-deoxy-D-manno-octulosonic acid kinase
MVMENLTWGVVPDGFRTMSDRGGNRLIVRQDQAGVIDFSICADAERTEKQVGYRGRAELRALCLPNGERALIRSYQHGGFFRAFTGQMFFTWPPRPFRELTITEELRRRGILTVEVYAACVRRICGPFYRGYLVTKELHGAQDLWAAFQSDFVEQAGLMTTLKAVAVSLRAMHRHGVYHRDLNLKNILVRLEPSGVKGYIIDFDKAKLFLGELPHPLVKKNLDRLLRSVCKLDPERKYFSAAAWNGFVNFYYEVSDA